MTLQVMRVKGTPQDAVTTQSSDFKLHSSLNITMLSDQPNQVQTLIMSKVSTITIHVNLDCTNFKFYWFRSFLFLNAIQNVNLPNEVKIAKTLTFSFRHSMTNKAAWGLFNMYKDMACKLCLLHIR